jgi:DNA repair protein RecO (recombination protein O)
MSLYRDVGVVVRSHKIGETDRIITIITQDSGKVRAVAKGVRKPGSRFGSRLEPMSHVQLQLYRGRELDIVNQVELVEVAGNVRGNLECTTDALAMCEIAERLSQERTPSPHLYRMLVGGIRRLNAEYSGAVLPALQLRLLAAEGVGPSFDRCIICDAEEGLDTLDVAGGGLRCKDHPRGFTVTAEAVSMVKEILRGNVASQLRRDIVPKSVEEEVKRIARMLMEHHLERRIRSQSLFESPRV